MPTFDVVIGNPPYKSGLHLSFLKIGYNISKKYVIWLSPSGWLLDEKGMDKKVIKIKNIIKDNIEYVKLFNGNYMFNVGLFMPFSIIKLNKDIKNQKIKVVNNLYDNVEYYDSIFEINKWNDKSIYPILKKRILSLSNKDSLLNHKNKKIGKYYVNLSLIRGHVLINNEQRMFQDDFYSFFPKDINIQENINVREKYKSKNNEGISLYFSFKTKNEASNFINFLKTRWAMFSLSIFKNNSNLDRGELGSVPWLDWTKEWTEQEFEKLINATEEEKQFIYNNIPKYYND